MPATAGTRRRTSAACRRTRDATSAPGTTSRTGSAGTTSGSGSARSPRSAVAAGGNRPEPRRATWPLARGERPPREHEALGDDVKRRERLLLGLRLDEPLPLAGVERALDHGGAGAHGAARARGAPRRGARADGARPLPRRGGHGRAARLGRIRRGRRPGYDCPAKRGDPAHPAAAADPRRRRRGARRHGRARRLQDARGADDGRGLVVDRPQRVRGARGAGPADAPAHLRGTRPDRARLPRLRGRAPRPARTRPGSFPLDLSALRSEVEAALQRTTEMLSEVTRLLALVSAPAIETARIHHVEVLLLRPTVVLVVVITSAGGVTKRVLTFAEPVDPGLVDWAREYLNEGLAGRAAGHAHAAAAARRPRAPAARACVRRGRALRRSRISWQSGSSASTSAAPRAS